MGVLGVGYSDLVRLTRSSCVRAVRLEAATWESSAVGSKRLVRLNWTSCRSCILSSSHTGILPPGRPRRRRAG